MTRKKPQGLPAMVLVLTLICAVMAAALAMVKDLTGEKIKIQEREFKLKSIRAVLPEYDNHPLQNPLQVPTDKGETVPLYIGKKDGRTVGVAFEMTNPQGYGGTISVLIGLIPDGTISGVEILDHKETPGLGSLITTEKWLQQFEGRTLQDTVWKVDKDGGDIQSITGATISPRAVTQAIKDGLEMFAAHKEQIPAKQ